MHLPKYARCVTNTANSIVISNDYLTDAEAEVSARCTLARWILTFAITVLTGRLEITQQPPLVGVAALSLARCEVDGSMLGDPCQAHVGRALRVHPVVGRQHPLVGMHRLLALPLVHLPVKPDALPIVPRLQVPVMQCPFLRGVGRPGGRGRRRGTAEDLSKIENSNDNTPEGAGG